MTVMRIAVVVVMLMMVKGEGDDTHARQEEALRKKLFTNYHREALPSDKNNVSMGAFQIQYLQMNEETHRLKINAWLTMDWYDPRLTWDKDQYSTIAHLTLAPGTVWMPDFTIYNGGDPDRQLITSNKKNRMLLYPNGNLLFVPSILLHFTCIMDLTYWPHDEHNCTLKIGSWVYDANVVDFLMRDVKPKDKLKRAVGWSGTNISTSEWEIVSTDVQKKVKYYDCCPEPYSSYLFSIYLKRLAPAYAWMVKGPLVCLTLLSVVVLLVPVRQCGAKMTVGCLLLIADLGFLHFASSVIAHNPSHTPLLVKLVVVEVVVVTVSVVVSGVVCWLAYSPSFHSSLPLPEQIRRPLLTLAGLLGLQSYGGHQGSDGTPLKYDEVEIGSDTTEGGGGGSLSGSKGGSELFLIAATLDRLAFILYLALTTLILISFSSVL